MTVAEREAWRDAILDKYKKKEWYNVLLLMALNHGDCGSIETMIKYHCDNADPVQDWQVFV